MPHRWANPQKCQQFSSAGTSQAAEERETEGAGGFNPRADPT
jgi:hypothetical protein